MTRVRLGRAAMIAVGLVLFGVIAVVVVAPLVTGGAARSVRTASMSPAIRPGSLVLDRPVDESELRVGNIATYDELVAGRRITITHRIVTVDRSVTPALVTFRGDANPVADPRPVPASAIRGRVWLTVPWLGTLHDEVIEFWWPLIGLGCGALACYAAGTISAARRAARVPA